MSYIGLQLKAWFLHHDLQQLREMSADDAHRRLAFVTILDYVRTLSKRRWDLMCKRTVCMRSCTLNGDILQLQGQN